VYDVFDRFDFDALWRDRRPVVDYVLGAMPTGGVFAVGYTADPFQRFTLDWYPPRMGPGPYYLFYRPYHLGHMEAMATVAEAALDGQAVLQPACGFRTNVYAYAKRDLRRGERLDGAGGYACYGLIENCDDGRDRPGLPICLADDVTLLRDVAKDERLNFDDARFRPDDAARDFYLECVTHAADMLRSTR
jgi:predicted homoserine dehydrogenase-like protein